ncbi:MAG: efflux RND transporter permease subunit [Angelakisella sp.]
MNLTKLTMRRPVSVFIIILALIVFGVQAMFTAPLELIPEMELPMVMIMTDYHGAGPDEVEELVTTVIEAAVATMPGVEDIYSQSQEGMSVVQMQLSYGTDMDKAYMDLQKKLDMYKSGLPETAGTPLILELSQATTMQDTISLAAKATGDVDLLNYINDTVKQEFEKINGVASVDISGGQSDYISIRLREEDLKQYGLDMNSISQIIATADFSMPAGSIDRGSSQLTMRGGVTYNTTESLRTLPLMLKAGGIIQLSDVADISEGKRDSSSISRYNGEETVNLGIKKRTSASTIDVCKKVVRTVEQLNTRGIGVELSVVNDTSEQIISAINTVVSTLILGIILSMLVLYAFFGEWKASIIVGSSMPISVLATIIIMSQMGFSFNIISLGGLVIGVGMMVDNSIVVIESCFRVREQQMDVKEAALEGTHVITSSIIASTLTTIVVFLPISLMQGMTGQLFKQLGYTIIFSLTMSLFSALTLVPLLFMRVSPKEKPDILMSRILARVGESYGRLLKKSFRKKWLIVLIAVVLLIASFASLTLVHMELIPSIDQGIVTIRTSNRPGLSIDKVDEIAASLEEIIKQEPDVDNYSVNGSGSGVSIYVYLKKDRVKTTAQVVDEWRMQTKDTIDYTVDVSSYDMASAMSGGGGVQVSLQGTDLDQLKLATGQVLDYMRSRPDIISATSNLTDGNPQAEIVVDPVKANAAGLMPAQIVQSVSSVMQGKKASTLRQDGHEYEIWVEYPEDSYGTITDLAGFTILNPMGMQIPLLDVAEIRYTNSPQSILKMNNQYQVMISAQPTSAAAITANQEVLAAVSQMKLPNGVSTSGGFSNDAMMEEFSAMGWAIAAAVFLVFMVMAMQFESVKFSLVVMMCIPFSLIGSFGLLALSGVTLSMPSLMGLLMLVGIVINNGILFIDTTNQLRTSMDAETALIYAGKTRMRPILMTTLTTVLSMLPMAFGIGDGSEIMQGMAVVIIGGLCASTVLTLLLLPAFYLLMNKDKAAKKAAKKAKREAKRRKKQGLPAAPQGEMPVMADRRGPGTYDINFLEGDDDLDAGFPKKELGEEDK